MEVKGYIGTYTKVNIEETTIKSCSSFKLLTVKLLATIIIIIDINYSNNNTAR